MYSNRVTVFPFAVQIVFHFSALPGGRLKSTSPLSPGGRGVGGEGDSPLSTLRPRLEVKYLTSNSIAVDFQIINRAGKVALAAC
jgi:hypothetical protein